MFLKNLTVGSFQANCYIAAGDGETDCAVIDPGDELERIQEELETDGLRCRCIFLTHGHRDHSGRAADLASATGAALYVHEKDLPIAEKTGVSQAEQLRTYRDGEEIAVGSLRFLVLETPGHTPGSVSLLCGDCLFTGDTLFRNSCGRTDLPGGDRRRELLSLRRLGELPGDYAVYPGHMRTTTMERERQFNLHMLQALGRD